MKNEKLILFILAVIQFSHIIDFMIIMPLGKQLMEIFSITPQQFSYIVSVYAGFAGVFVFLSAFFIDRFDRKWALLVVYIGFTIGTLACAFANSYYFFLAARGVAGAFGGMLSALVLSIIGDAIPFERRASAMGIVMMAFSAASVIGVPAGLWIAAEYEWRTTFLIIGLLSVGFIFLILFYMPSLRMHLDTGKVQRNPVKILTNVLNDNNQLRAILFNTLVILGHFLIIPFIAPYMQINIGFSDYQVTYIYLIGGALTVIFLPLVGKIADRRGNPKVFIIGSILAIASIFMITNLPAVPIWIALVVSSTYFVASSARNVPSVTMVTSVVKPESRGSFMSIRSASNQLAMFLSSIIAGAIVIEGEGGLLENYELVGYLAIIVSFLAILFVNRLKVVS
ncbi:MAG: MFS transporter [Bacteroidetes bacterium]|jgi:predicted MFS family arabinose efflux permease|nr:MFS transporter [Bacteroidota bacterium]